MSERPGAYLDALADGEDARVPAAVRAHVSGCPDCRAEIRVLTLLSRRLRAAAPVRSRARSVTFALAAALVLVLATAVVPLTASADTVAASAVLASAPAQFASSDPTAIREWCAGATGWSLQIETPLALSGVRMDRAGGRDVVTVFYGDADGARVAVTWTEGSGRGDASIRAQRIGGRLTLVVRSRAGTALVGGSASDGTLWKVAASLASAP